MSFSSTAATQFVPFLARIVLAAAFIPAGWGKLMNEVTFEGEEAAILRSHGVGGAADPLAAHGDSRSGPAQAGFGGLGGDGWTLLAVAASQEAPPAGPAATPPPVPTGGGATPPRDGVGGVDVDGEGGAGAPPAAAETPGATAAGAAPIGADGAPLTARALHRITLMVHRAELPEPVYQAYAAVGVELIGGALILVGLFSRIWGLGLAATMGMAFYLTTLPVVRDAGLFDLPIPDFNRLFAQAGLFVLAFGVAVTGPGALSIDRLIFRPSDLREET